MKNCSFTVSKAFVIHHGGKLYIWPFLIQIDTFGKWIRLSAKSLLSKNEKTQISEQTQIIWVRWSLCPYQNRWIFEKVPKGGGGSKVSYFPTCPVLIFSLNYWKTYPEKTLLYQFINFMPKKHCLKVQILQHKFLNWKQPPSLRNFSENLSVLVGLPFPYLYKFYGYSSIDQTLVHTLKCGSNFKGMHNLWLQQLQLKNIPKFNKGGRGVPPWLVNSNSVKNRPENSIGVKKQRLRQFVFDFRPPTGAAGCTPFQKFWWWPGCCVGLKNFSRDCTTLHSIPFWIISEG